MAEEISKVVLQLVADATGLVAGVAAGQKSMTELNQTMELSRKAFGLLQGAYTTLESVLDRGQAVTKLTDAFNQLQAKAGNLATGELKALSAASQGVISDFDLMRNSNQALLSGIKPDQFRVMAEAAGGLADAVGGDAKQALDDLTKALSSGATAGLEKTYGLVIDNAKAYDDFAKTLGKTGSELNEIGKREAVRIAVVEKLKEKIEDSTEANLTAKEGLEKLQVSSQRVFDSFAVGINSSGALASAFDDISSSVSFIDTDKLEQFGELLGYIASLPITGLAAIADHIGAITSAINGATGSSGNSAAEQIKALNNELKTLESGASNSNGVVDKLLDFFDPSANASATQGRITRIKDTIRGLGQELFEETKASLEAQARLLDNPFGSTRFTSETVRPDRFLNQEKLKAESAKAIEEAAKVEAARAKLRQQFVLDGLKLESDTFKGGIEQALEQFDFGSAQGFFQRYEASLAKATEEGLRASLTDESGTLTVSEAELKSRVQSTIGPQLRAVEAEITESMNESFNNSVSFFADILTPMFEGQAANFEDIFRDAAKRVAIGFASQMLASITTSLGFTGLSNIAGAQGLGQSIAAALGFGGGGVTSITDIFGDGGVALSASAVALDGSAVALTGAAAALSASAGAQAAGGVPGVPKVLSAEFIPGMETLLTKAGIGAAVLVATAITAKSGFDSFKAGQQGGIGAGVRAGFNSIDDLGAAFASGGLSIPINLAAGIAGSFFGGDSKLAQEREARENALSEIFGDVGASFQGVNGLQTLGAGDFNASGKFGGQGIGLVNPLAQILSGGDDKLGSDLAGIFENAVTDAENFNEVIINTASLMDRLGVDAEAAKDELATLFLDGKISAEEFTTGIHNLNLVAQEDLLGENSINEAFEVLSKNLGEGGSPRIALKGLQLLFKEMAQAGIDTQAEIVEFTTNTFGPEIGAVFQELGEQGIDSFEDLENVAPDALAGIVNTLSDLEGAFAGVGSAAEDVGDADGLEKQANKANDLSSALENATKRARELKKELASIPSTPAGATPGAGETGLSRSPG